MRSFARGLLMSVAVVAGLLPANPATALIVSNGKIVPEWPSDATSIPAGAALAAPAPNIGQYPRPKGIVYGLTLLIDFEDVAPAFNKQQIDEWLNLKGYTGGGLNGSVRDYYADVSNGMVDFQNEIFGFYRAKQPKSYYEGRPGYSGSDELFNELMDYFDQSVDFSKYDNDGDGATDAVSIVYAGDAQTWGQGLWPHASSSNDQRDGVTVRRYMMTNLGKQLGLYTFAHEVGHMLFGWPDLYGFGNYCLMGNGSSQQNPVGINDFYRADQGWIPVIDVTADTNARLEAQVNGAGYRYTNPSRPEESFFWSNLQSSKRFDTIQGDGLLLLHFDKKIGNNSPPKPLSLAVVQADGKKDLDQTMWPNPGSDAADYFHAGGVDEFSEQAFETARWNDGSGSKLRIYDVGAIGASIPFKVGNGPIVEQPSGGAGGMAGAASGGSGGGLGGAAGTAGITAAAGAMAVGGSSTAGSGLLPGAGQAGTGGGAGAMVLGASSAVGDDSGCACRQVGGRANQRAWLLTAVAGAAGVLRRRRRKT